MKSKSSAGFSLVELLVVIAIIGILSSAGIITYNGYVEGTKKNSAENIIQQISLAQSEEYANTGSYSVTGTGPTSSCSASAASSEEIESELFAGEDIIPNDIDFEICIFGSASSFTIRGEHQKSSCVISLARNGATTRTDC